MFEVVRIANLKKKIKLGYELVSKNWLPPRFGYKDIAKFEENLDNSFYRQDRMPHGFNKHTSDIESIVGVQFSIFSPEEIERSSVVEITSHITHEGNEPKIGGLFDPRMGVLDNGKVCRTCAQTNHGCPGHFGHYRLTRPVYYIQFM